MGIIALMKKNRKATVGIIGTGWVGDSYLNDFVQRGFDPICYSLEPQYAGNKARIKECEIVFIAVPTPTTPRGFDDSILRNVIKLVGKGKTAVIKSTMLPGTTESIQRDNPNIFVLHAPEFLLEKSAHHDAAHPLRNIIGIPRNTPVFKKKAQNVLSILPKAPFNIICSSVDAEFIKYARNCVGYFRILFYNLLYDLANKKGSSWHNIQKAIAADPDNGLVYTSPFHKGGRGAGGNCFIKDFAAFTNYYEKNLKDPIGLKVLRTLERKNIELLKKTKKDLKLLKDVYGKI